MAAGVRPSASDRTTSSAVLASSTSKMSWRTPTAMERVLEVSETASEGGESGAWRAGRRRSEALACCQSSVEAETKRIRFKAASTPASREATARASSSFTLSRPPSPGPSPSPSAPHSSAVGSVSSCRLSNSRLSQVSSSLRECRSCSASRSTKRSDRCSKRIWGEGGAVSPDR
jgi:hypothetical protein